MNDPDQSATTSFPMAADVHTPKRPPELKPGKPLVSYLLLYRGGIALSLGLGLVIATEAALLPRIPMLYAAMVLGGLAAVQMGRARKHLIRFGSKTSLVGFTALAGSGVSFAVGVALNFLRNVMGVPVPQWLLNALGISAYGLAVVVVLVVLKTIASWILGSFGASDAEDEALNTM